MEAYFVGCNSEAPEHLYFCMQKAVEGNHDYLTIFDENGMKLREFKRTLDFVGEREIVSYTPDF
jgi:hypothetical protein